MRKEKKKKKSEMKEEEKYSYNGQYDYFSQLLTKKNFKPWKKS